MPAEAGIQKGLENVDSRLPGDDQERDEHEERWDFEMGSTSGFGSGQFPIVGVGASAGRVEASTHLLENLLLIQAWRSCSFSILRQRRKSILSELLSKVTPMPVREVMDGMNTAVDVRRYEVE